MGREIKTRRDGKEKVGGRRNGKWKFEANEKGSIGPSVVKSTTMKGNHGI